MLNILRDYQEPQYFEHFQDLKKIYKIFQGLQYFQDICDSV